MTTWSSDELKKIGNADEYPQYVAPMLTAEVRATTIKLVPHSTTTGKEN